MKVAEMNNAGSYEVRQDRNLLPRLRELEQKQFVHTVLGGHRIRHEEVAFVEGQFPPGEPETLLTPQISARSGHPAVQGT